MVAGGKLLDIDDCEGGGIEGFRVKMGARGALRLLTVDVTAGTDCEREVPGTVCHYQHQIKICPTVVD